MFQTVDAIADGRYFWRSLEKLRRPPFDCTISGLAATLADAKQGLALIVASSDDGQPRRVFVRLLDVPSGDVIVDATLNGDFTYRDGLALGMPADEVAATEALSMFAGDVGGDWAMVASGEPESDEEEEEGGHA